MTFLNKVPKDTLILVCDAQKALIVGNSGTPVHPELVIEKTIEFDEDEFASAREDRSGRRFDGGGTGGSFRARSAMETSDQHAEVSAKVAVQIVAELANYIKDRRTGQIVVVAPPAFLGLLRTKYTDSLNNKILDEVPKNLTEMPVKEIQKALVEKW